MLDTTVYSVRAAPKLLYGQQGGVLRMMQQGQLAE